NNGDGTATFNPAGLSGSITVTYSYTDGNSCSNSDTANILVNTAPTVDAGNYGPLCDNVSPITLTGTPTNSNGTWSGTGVTNNGDGTATFNPAGLSGSITVTYSYTDGNSCSNSDTANILVNTAPTVDAGNYGPLCDNVSPITLTGTPTNSNGTWSGTGVTNNGDGTATFNPAGLSGSITVTYSYTDGNSCSNSDTANILVNTAPTVDAGNYGPLCDNVSPITLTGTPTNSNGTWSGTGVTNNGDGTATFNPAGLSGSITVTYSYTDGNSCANSDTANIMVNISPSAPLSGGNQTECIADPIQTLTATASVPPGQSIVWYDLAVGGNVVTPTWSSIGSKTYYAEAVNNSTSCKSSTRTPVTLTLNNCGIQIEKIASPNNPQGCTPLAPGETISYTFRVSNLGNTPINNVVLNDPLIDPINPIPGPTSGDTTNAGVLDIGEIWVYNATYTVVQQDIINGQVQNTATVNGQVQTSGNPYPVSNSDTVTVNLCQNAEMSIVKSSTSATGNCIPFEVGGSIDYKFVVSNDGDVDITNVVVNDARLGGVIPGPSLGDTNNDNILNVGEAWTYNATYIVNQTDINFGSVVNTATVSGNTALGTRNATSNTVTVLICQTASISVIKSQTNAAGGLGDLITYDIVVTNTGNTTVSNIEVTDANAVITGGNPIASLLPGASATVTAQHEITQADLDLGYVENIAVGTGDSVNGTDDVTDTSDTGTDTGGNTIPDPETVETPDGDGTTNGDPTDDPTVTVLEQTASISVIKSQTNAAGGL
ncbi:beta strand repeat-containing protein, partial [Aequorivita vladivostokensis]